MPQEGGITMPDEPVDTTQPADEGQDVTDTTGPDEPAGVDGTDESEGDGQSGSQEDAEDKPEAFDRKRYEAELKKKNSEAANLRKRLKELEPLAAKARELEDANKSETERLTERLTAAEAKVADARTRLVKQTVRSLAARADGGRPALADPEDAVGALDLTSYLDADGEIDESAIEADLTALVERKPHWAKAAPPEGPRRPAPDRTQASGANNQRSSLTPQDEFAGLIGGLLKR
jgi:hypothetical protein